MRTIAPQGGVAERKGAPAGFCRCSGDHEDDMRHEFSARSSALPLTVGSTQAATDRTRTLSTRVARPRARPSGR